MKNRPLVSLVVPTKNRYPYLKKLIELLQDFHLGPDFELVIQDNNEDNTMFLEYIETKEMPYLKYYHVPKPMPIGPNCDNAIRHSTGEYVCFIGDDDFITENFIPCIKWMKNHNVECVFPKRIMYFWPDYCDHGEERAAVHFEEFSKEVRYVDTKEALDKVIESGCIWPGDMPMLYHGIVKRSVLEKIWEKCGTLFPGASPDIASGVSLCMVLSRYVSLRFPIIISGNSRTGGGGQKVIKHNAELDFGKLPFLPKNISDIWDKRVPKIWSNSTIWCESAIEALKAWDRQDIVDQLNFEALYENFVVNYFYYRKMAFELTSNRKKLMFNSAKGILILYSKSLIKFALRRCHLHLHNTRIKIEGIQDSKQLCEYFRRNGYIFEDYFK